MTEQDWLTCDDPRQMIRAVVGKVSERKFRLLAAGLARLFWEELPEGELRRAIEAAERQADGQASPTEWAEYENRFYRCFQRGATPEQRQVLPPAVSQRAFNLVFAVTYGPILINSLHGAATWANGVAGIENRVTPLVRDVVGNPFRPPHMHPEWRTADAVGVASAVYEERAFERLPLLASALMDAGCDDEQVISHCTRPGPHVRGCWVIDLILGKS